METNPCLSNSGWLSVDEETEAGEGAVFKGAGFSQSLSITSDSSSASC